MNAPLPRLATDLAPIEDVFFARCEARSLLHLNGYLSLHDAVDELQGYAEHSGLVDFIGQDAVQDIMSGAFMFAEMLPDELSEACDREIMLRTADLVRQWELDDLRDRWRHTGETPPKPSKPILKNQIVRSRKRSALANRQSVGHVRHMTHLKSSAPAATASRIPLHSLRSHRAQPYRTPQATVDAFLYVASLSDPKQLRDWLHDRPRDKAHLLKILESKRCCKFQPKK